jgi:hypothetical protein
MQETIARNVVVMLALAVVAVGAAIWVPQNAAKRGAPVGFPASYTSSFNHLHAQATAGRVVVSYNDPQVRKTLDLPWAR